MPNQTYIDEIPLVGSSTVIAVSTSASECDKIGLTTGDAFNTPRWVFIALSACIGVTSLALNGLVLVAFLKHRKYLMTKETILIANLAFANLVEGIALTPISILSLMIFLELPYRNCIIFNIAYITLRDLSINMVILIAVQRLFDRNRFHKGQTDLKNTFVTMAIAWLFALGSVILPFHFYTRDPKDYQNICYLSAVIYSDFYFYYEILFQYLGTVIVLSYVYLYITVIKAVRRISTRRVLNLREDHRPGVVTVTFVILVYFVAHTPSAIVHSLEFFQLLPCSSAMVYLEHIARLIERIEEVMNPIIYAGNNAMINEAVRNLLFHTKVDKTRTCSTFTSTEYDTGTLSLSTGSNKMSLFTSCCQSRNSQEEQALEKYGGPNLKTLNIISDNTSMKSENFLSPFSSSGSNNSDYMSP